jgi:hypothetical protein
MSVDTEPGLKIGCNNRSFGVFKKKMQSLSRGAAGPDMNIHQIRDVFGLDRRRLVLSVRIKLS